MKIECTQEEKKEIIKALKVSEYFCFSPVVNGDECIYDSCDECIDKNIEWVITDNSPEIKNHARALG